jgi:hypothetical protein
MGTVELVAVAALVVMAALRWRRSAVQRKRGFFAAPRRLRFYDFRNVIVADERGTTEVDVIVVGNAGIFVVEIKDYNAWIFGNEQDDKWTACYVDKSKYQFQNPLRQNFRHVKALQARLGLPSEMFQSIVAFTGDCEFKTPMPPNVIAGHYRSLIENVEDIRLPDSEVRRVCQVLEVLEAASTSDAIESHVANLKARYSSKTNCPKCGAALVERRSRTATSGDATFLGCQGYPRCRYTRQVDAT